MALAAYLSKFSVTFATMVVYPVHGTKERTGKGKRKFPPQVHTHTMVHDVHMVSEAQSSEFICIQLPPQSFFAALVLLHPVSRTRVTILGIACDFPQKSIIRGLVPVFQAKYFAGHSGRDKIHW